MRILECYIVSENKNICFIIETIISERKKWFTNDPNTFLKRTSIVKPYFAFKMYKKIIPFDYYDIFESLYFIGNSKSSLRIHSIIIVVLLNKFYQNFTATLQK